MEREHYRNPDNFPQQKIIKNKYFLTKNSLFSVAFHLFLVAFSYQKFIVETVENTLFSEAKKSHQK
jgi:hypothetical protein